MELSFMHLDRGVHQMQDAATNESPHSLMQLRLSKSKQMSLILKTFAPIGELSQHLAKMRVGGGKQTYHIQKKICKTYQTSIDRIDKHMWFLSQVSFAPSDKFSTQASSLNDEPPVSLPSYT